LLFTFSLAIHLSCVSVNDILLEITIIGRRAVQDGGSNLSFLLVLNFFHFFFFSSLLFTVQGTMNINQGCDEKGNSASLIEIEQIVTYKGN